MMSNSEYAAIKNKERRLAPVRNDMILITEWLRQEWINIEAELRFSTTDIEKAFCHGKKMILERMDLNFSANCPTYQDVKEKTAKRKRNRQ